MPDNERCRAMHLGLWLIEPVWASARLSAIKAGLIRAEVAPLSPPPTAAVKVSDGVAVIPITDMMTKGQSKYGGTSTVWVRQAIRAALAAEDVKGILLVIDSPGGTVAGTQELADEVLRASTRKPLWAQISDLGASAAYWIASQAQKVFANKTAEVGSIGTVAVVDDVSKAADMQGVSVHVISTGEYKGAFTAGAPVTGEQLDYLRARVEDLNKFFLAGVQGGRGLDKAGLTAVADGRVWIAAKAKKLGLIDGVQGFDQTLQALSTQSSRRRTRAEDAALRIKLEENI